RVFASAGQGLNCSTAPIAISSNPPMNRIALKGGLKERNPPPKTSTIPSAPNPIALPVLLGPAPAPESFRAKYGPKINGSQEMPMIAPPPPAWLLNHGLGQLCNSP